MQSTLPGSLALRKKSNVLVAEDVDEGREERRHREEEGAGNSYIMSMIKVCRVDE